MFSAIVRALRGMKHTHICVRNIGKETKWPPFTHPHTATYSRDWWTEHLPRVGDILAFFSGNDSYEPVRLVVKEVRHFDNGSNPGIIADFASAHPADGRNMELCGFTFHRHDGRCQVTLLDPIQYGRYQVQTAA